MINAFYWFCLSSITLSVWKTNLELEPFISYNNTLLVIPKACVSRNETSSPNLSLIEDGRGMKLTFEFKMLNFGFFFMYDKRVTTIMFFIILHMSTMGFLVRKKCCAFILWFCLVFSFIIYLWCYYFLQNWCQLPLLLVSFYACTCTKHMISFMTLVQKSISDRYCGRGEKVTRPQVPCVTQKGPKSWICGIGQKLGAAPNFQH